VLKLSLNTDLQGSHVAKGGNTYLTILCNPMGYKALEVMPLNGHYLLYVLYFIFYLMVSNAHLGAIIVVTML
jgi:hypothetical protein